MTVPSEGKHIRWADDTMGLGNLVQFWEHRGRTCKDRLSSRGVGCRAAQSTGGPAPRGHTQRPAHPAAAASGGRCGHGVAACHLLEPAAADAAGCRRPDGCHATGPSRLTRSSTALPSAALQMQLAQARFTPSNHLEWFLPTRRLPPPHTPLSPPPPFLLLNWAAQCKSAVISQRC